MRGKLAKPVKDVFDPTFKDSETIKKKIQDIINARYDVLAKNRRDLDARAKTEINEKCP
jgi:hypothetical protein